MSVRSAYRERRRLRLPPRDLTPFYEEMEGRPRLMWASFLTIVWLAACAATYLIITG